MHNAAFAALGLNWRYLAFEVRPDDLRAAIAGAKAMQFSGLNADSSSSLSARPGCFPQCLRAARQRARPPALRAWYKPMSNW